MIRLYHRKGAAAAGQRAATGAVTPLSPVRRGLFGLVGLAMAGTASLSLLAASSQAYADSLQGKRVELLVMEQVGCGYCEQWRAEIGATYSTSSEAKRAKLRYVDIHDPLPEDLEIKGTAFTPSFVLAIDGVEVSRMEGYLSESFFWGYLDSMLDKHLGKASAE